MYFNISIFHALFCCITLLCLRILVCFKKLVFLCICYVHVSLQTFLNESLHPLSKIVPTFLVGAGSLIFDLRVETQLCGQITNLVIGSVVSSQSTKSKSKIIRILSFSSESLLCHKIGHKKG